MFPLDLPLQPPIVAAVSGGWVTAYRDGTVEITGRMPLADIIRLAAKGREGVRVHGDPFIAMLGPI